MICKQAAQEMHFVTITHKARAVAMTSLLQTPGCEAWTAEMTFAVCRDMTATGPMETSLEVAKKAYLED